MKSVRFIIFLLASVCMLTMQAQVGPDNSGRQQPNVLLIIVDDLKPMLGNYSDPDIKTPGIDRLAATGITFENAYCQQAVCAPSRISFFTGKRPDRTRVYDLQTLMRDMNPDIITMPQFFQAHGYETAGLGKLMHGAKGNDPESWSIGYVWDKKLEYAKGYGVPADGKYQDPKILKAFREGELNGMEGKVLRSHLAETGLLPSVEAIEVPDDAYPDGAIAENGIRLMKKLASRDKPFFLALGFHKPHLPFAVPKKYWDIYERQAIEIHPFQEESENSPGYAYHTWGELRNYSDIPDEGELDPEKQREVIHGYMASVSYVDAQIGKVLDALEDLNIDDNTIVVLYGDHGWHLGDHGLWCKHSNFEQAVKVPLIIRAPGYASGKSASTMVELVDIFPTLSDYAGLEVPEYLEGNSLLNVLENTGAQVKDYAISQYPRGDNIMGYSLRTRRYRLTLWLKGDFMTSELFRTPLIEAAELYDYVNDPLEQISLAYDPAYAETVAALKSQLLSLLNSQADKFAQP